MSNNGIWSVRQLSEELLMFRREQKLSQATMAGLLGISRNYYSQIERGEAANISMEIYAQVCDLIGHPHQSQETIRELFTEMYTAYYELAGMYGCDYCLDVAQRWVKRYAVITGHAMRP